MFITVFVSCLLLGSCVGFLSGLLGIGGGLVIVPSLIYLLPKLAIDNQVIMPIALATSLASIVITSSMAALAHNKNKNIPWPLAKRLMVFVAGGALIGAFIADALSTKMLTTIFAGAVLLLASYMLLSIGMTKTRSMPGNKVLQSIGLFTGVIASLMGIAGGAILVPVLSFCGMPLRQTIGIATICGVMVALFGSLGYVISGFNHALLPPWSLGYIYLPALLGLTLTSSLLAPYGVKFAEKLPVKTLKKCFAAFLILVAIKMIWQ